MELRIELAADGNIWFSFITPEGKVAATTAMPFTDLAEIVDAIRNQKEETP